MIKIRLARCGRKKRPLYTIVATESRSPRDGRFLEKLGQYNPLLETSLINVQADAIAKWVKQGAVCSDTVRTLLKKNKIQIHL